MDSNEDTAEAVGAFGESTCGTRTPDDTYPQASWSCGEFSSNFTSTTGYGHTDCTNGFIVDFQNPRSGLGGYATWGTTAPATQTECLKSVVKISTYDNAGTLIGTTSNIGTWNGTSCVMPTVSNGLNNLSGSNSWGRVVAQAYVCNDGLLNCSTNRSYKNVTVWAQYPVC
ncbi:hypothetical protein [Polyangium sp. 6x1]|uniref:hypothetical protein n=1 Tax=Polyangium sp. 6x1 TaxID=3042689 RepID=UPI0024830B60|nr:hypothetical protein [Polyangium sp. 6x1]MDI1446200.1 hypothetical protein [Polyangium sp. 6x1]